MGIFLVGGFILQRFPQTQPIWEAAKTHASSVYSLLVTEFGMAGAVLVIIAVIIIFGGSKKGW